MKRCKWADGSDIYREYHDHEWGVPVYDDRKIFEFLILESAQAGRKLNRPLTMQKHF